MTENGSQLVNETLDEVVNQICESLQNGERVDIDGLADAHPEIASQLRSLYPTLLAISSLESSNTENRLHRPAGDDQQNMQLGDFRIIRQIGRGGMGVVYEAEQQSIRRSVALKILPLAALVDARALQRFKNEVAAIATLDHPHIVSVYSIGEERGIHYFAMQLIRGQSLAAVVAELHARTQQQGSVTGPALNQVVWDLEGETNAQTLEEKGSSPFTDETHAETVARGQSQTAPGKMTDPVYFRNVAELMLQATDALQHAHDHGIVHRDVKPANLLLNSTNNLYVTDFGLARIETGAGVTMTGDIMGTLRYMSPEQVLANRVVIDHRTDIYSLGATLYELLALQPMWSGNDKAELIRQVSFEEPIEPRKLNPAIPVDLNTIVLKAISKNSNDRYDSAQAFGDDLQSFLDHKPIVARRATLAQRFAKWSQRHSAVVWAGVILLLIFSIGSAVAASLIWYSRIQLEQSLNEKQIQFERAEKNFAIAWQTVDTMLDDVADELEHKPHLQPLRRKLLDQALEFYGEFRNQKSDDSEVLYRSGKAHYRSGFVHQLLGESNKGKAEFETAIRVFSELIEKHPKNMRYLKGLGEVHHSLAFILVRGKNRPAALNSLRKSVNLMERVVAARPEDSIDRINIANSYNYLAQQRIVRGEFRQAAIDCQKGLDHLTAEAEQKHPDWALSVRGMLVHTKGRIANRQKQQENARVFFEQSIELLNRSLELNSEHRMTRSVLGVAYGNLALVTLDLDQKESALQIRLDVFHSLVADYPSMPRYKSDLALAHESIADLLTKQNRHQEASDHYRQAIELIEQALQLVPGEPALRYALAGAWQNLALSSSDFDLSSAARKKKLEITRSLVSDFPADPEYKAELADALKDWAKVLAAKDREREAEQLFRESIQLTDALITDFPETWEHQRLFARSRTQLSQMLFGQGRYAETVQLLEEAIPVWIKLAEDRPDELMIFRNLITCQQLMGNSFESLEKTPLPSSAAHELSDHLTQRGQRSEATAFELNYIAWSLLGIEFPTVTEPELALEFAGRACRIAEQQHNANLPLYLDTLAMAQHQAGDSPSAIRTQTRAISLLSESTDKTVADQMDRNLKMYLESESEKSGSKNTDD